MIVDIHQGMGSTRREGGFVLVSVAVLLVILIGFLAISVSTGYLYSARTTAQEIGDASSLTGAYTYITTPETDDAVAKASAEYHAVQFALSRAQILGVDLEEADITAFADVPNRRVEVTIDSMQPTFFGRILGLDEAHIQTVSLAEAGSVASGDSCTRPFFIPNNVFRPDTPGDVERCLGCADGGSNLIVAPTGENGAWIATDFAMGIIADPDNEFTLYPGGPGGAISPGQYYLIDLFEGENAGADDIADWIRDCDPAVNRTECSEEYSVKTGATGGGVKNGLFGNGIHPGLIGAPADTWPLPEGTGSDQMIVAPIWDVCSFDDVYCETGGIGTGTNVSMPIVGYAQIFLKAPEGGGGGGPDDVKAVLVNVIGCGELPDGGIGPDPDPHGSTVLGRPLRLVREPPAG